MAQAPKVDVLVEVTAASKVLAPAVKRLTKALAKLDLKGMPIGATSDMLYDLRQLTKLLGTLSAPFEDLLTPVIRQVEDHFVSTLAVGESSGVQGKKSRTQISELVVPVIDTSNDGWKKFYAHIKKTGEFELLNRAINRAAITERWDAKKNVPGISKFHQKRVSCTKLSGK